MQLIGIQLDTAWEDKAASHARVRAILETVPIRPGALIVLPEMFATGFSVNIAAIGEQPTMGESQRFLSELAVDRQAYVMGGVVIGLEGGRGGNESVTYGPDGAEIARYRKLHSFTFGGETEHYDAGDQALTFRWRQAVVAPFICYDLRFPEVFRYAVSGGAEVMAVIANWPAERQEHWLALLRARAIENQAYVIGVNRCGRDPKLSYAGGSQIIDPQGEVVADAGTAQGVVEATIDLPALQSYRRTFSAVADMRSEFIGKPR